MIYGYYNNYCSPCNISNCYNIKVEGDGSVTIDPDLATIIIGVTIEDENLQEAQRENRITSNNVLNALVDIGVEREDIQTIDYRVDKVYEYIDDERILKGYKVTNKFKVTIQNVNEVGKVIDTTISNGANEVSNVNFTLSQPSIHYQKALSMAVSNAVAKAMEIGQSLNVRVNPTPLRVGEENYTSDYIPREPVFRAPDEETPIIPQDINIKAKVLAEFIYEKSHQY